MYKVGKVGIFVLLKFENKLDTVRSVTYILVESNMINMNLNKNAFQ